MALTISASTGVGLSLVSGDNPLTILAGDGITAAAAAVYGDSAAYWNIGNSGTLIGNGNTAAAHYGIGLTGGGFVENASAALIEGYGFGVLIRGTGSVVNNGTIEAFGTALAKVDYTLPPTASITALAGGVVLGAGGISNAAGAVIAGQGVGVSLSGAASLLNAGLITAAGTRAFAVVLGGPDSVTNQQGGDISASYFGLIALGAATSLTNAGSIAGSYFGVELGAGGTMLNAGNIAGGALGFGLFDQGYAQNTGQISGADGVLINGSGTLANQGNIAATNYGVLLAGPGTIDNSGAITSTHTLGDNAVNLRYGGSLTNAAGGTIAGPWIGVGIGNNTLVGTIISTIVNAGSIGALDSAGDGADLWLRGPAYVLNTGVISAGPFGLVLYDPTTVVNLGTITGGSIGIEGAIAAGNAALMAANASLLLEQAPRAVLTGNVTAPIGSGGSAANTLELLAGNASGTISNFGQRYLDFGNIAIDPGARWLVTGQAQYLAAADISGFAPGSTLELTGTIENYVSLAGGTLTLSGGTTLNLAGTAQVAVANDGSNTFITACFAAGTTLLTATGPVAVEALREGDRLATPRGLVAVSWIGHRHTQLARHPRPHDVMPVRIRAGAFAEGQPRRDLVLSPDHAVLVEGALIPIRHLVNGVSIVQETREHITYWHLELPRHDIILAEGLACESYLDTGNRSAFDQPGGATQLHPNFARANGTAPSGTEEGWTEQGWAEQVWAAQGCADILTDPASLPLRAAHTRLLARAHRYGSANSTTTGTWSEGWALARSSRSGAA